MSSYRFLQEAYIGDRSYLAGTQASTAGVGGTLPANWVPGGYVEPMDAAAASDFYAAGPQLTPLVRQRYSDILLTRYPVTFWKAGPGAGEWSLTGLGSGFAPVGGSPMSLP
jgi:hypothetical protein